MNEAFSKLVLICPLIFVIYRWVKDTLIKLFHTHMGRLGYKENSLNMSAPLFTNASSDVSFLKIGNKSRGFFCISLACLGRRAEASTSWLAQEVLREPRL